MRGGSKIFSFDIAHRDFFLSLFGRDVYLVGGGVRDLLLGRGIKEIDLLIARYSLEDITEKLRPFGKINLVGKSFAVLKFHYEGEVIEIAIPRKERRAISESSSHKNFIVEADPFLPIEEDLKRRDFTVNSMAMRLSDFEIIDPLGGRQDVKKKILRMSNPEAFSDDPLRVLRAARFAAKLDFKIHNEIYQRAKKISFTEIPRERILEEIYKLHCTERPQRGWEELLPLGVLEKVFPELYILTFWIQDGIFHPETDYYGNHTIWPHTLLTLMQASRLAKLYEIKNGRRQALLFSALLHDIAKPSCSKWEWKGDRLVIRTVGHDIEGENMAKEFCGRFGIHSYMGYPLRKRILKLVKTHHRLSEIYNQRESVTKKAFNRFAKELDGEYMLGILLDVADRNARGQSPLNDIDEPGRWLLEKFEEFKTSEVIKPLVMGRDLLSIGFNPGPKLGAVLKRLYEMQLDGEFDKKEEGIKLAEKVTIEIFGIHRV